ncbi:MATE family efflux transporter [Gemmatimonas sp.]|uniref:MATE family efflux transporter n=2 Tax=Gemmatimonas sp. TaxID=1962908 RepID=UPI0022C84E0C|nr:MATE family efflux transporter [Gemmatimonas sp.]MCA2982299.1 MATE family efflux transporter [Gemmatimonas sp.]MCA2986977.1 MATE family efflux transporter [Gemmatimonas sp.]MCA2990906.1 MATE family efflux transporter [Gemmatimonas sp.]MCA2995668.1 MATE family efflux transporter [Gemmatimonas sp.]MCE2953251.1 MATE family efflux transporter [Gemmatimonas sp.]
MAAAPSTTATRRIDRSLVEGPIGPAVWKVAWPTVLQNVISGVQGMIDHALVGHFVGFAGNAAIGVGFQIFLVVMVFVSSLFSGMGVLVARFAGAGDEAGVNRAASQAFLLALVLSLGVLAPLGYLLAPTLLGLVKAAPDVQREALPYLRIMFVFGFGMMMFFMLGGALRSAGDAKTPLRLGVALTVGNIVFNVLLIRGYGPFPEMGTAGAAAGIMISSALVAVYAVAKLFSGAWIIDFRGMSWKPDWEIIRALFRFGLPTGVQGIAMNIAGVLLLRFIGSTAQSAEAQAAYAVGYTELFSLVTWTSVGLMGAAATVAGQNLGAGHPERSRDAVRVAARFGLAMAIVVGLLFVTIPDLLLGLFGMTEPEVLRIGRELLRVLSVSGLFITVALTFTGGLQGTGDTRSPLYITLVSQFALPIGFLSVMEATRPLETWHIWLAILMGHATRCLLSVWRFEQGKWRSIELGVRSR